MLIKLLKNAGDILVGHAVSIAIINRRLLWRHSIENDDGDVDVCSSIKSS